MESQNFCPAGMVQLHVTRPGSPFQKNGCTHLYTRGLISKLARLRGRGHTIFSFHPHVCAQNGGALSFERGPSALPLVPGGDRRGLSNQWGENTQFPRQRRRKRVRGMGDGTTSAQLVQNILDKKRSTLPRFVPTGFRKT